MKKAILTAICATGIGFTTMLAAAEANQNVAIIDDINGSVLVNTGEKFVPAVEGQSLNAGDRVMTTKNGTAVLVFDNNCRRDVQVNTMVIVPDRSVCEGGIWNAQSKVGAGLTGSGNAGIYTLSTVALIIAALEIHKSP